ncbi:hypothetical protein C5167_026887 [Papaver somniferum]|nr:hypothetical protein C5167_026887 [Papaver somniferum]
MCPVDILKLGSCVDVLGGIVGIIIGGSAKEKCCPLLQGVADLDAALCLCTAIEAKLLNVDIVLPIALSVLINDCGKNPPSGFTCPTNASPPPKSATPTPPTTPTPTPPKTPTPPASPTPTPPTTRPPPTPTPTPPTTTPPPMNQGMCPVDILKLGGCVDVLGGIVGIIIGGSAKEKCCPLLQGIADVDAALCLCTAIEAKLLNVDIVLPIALNVLINDCGKNPPSGFTCPTSAAPTPPTMIPPPTQTPTPPTPTPTPPTTKPPPTQTPTPPTPKPTPPTTTPPPMGQEMCPVDILKLGGCVDVLGGLLGIVIGGSAKEKCCPLLAGIADLDAALCLCTTIKAKLLNIDIVLPIALQVLIQDCGKHPPPEFTCPS